MRYFIVNEIDEVHGYGRKRSIIWIAKVMFKVNPRQKPVELYKVSKHGLLKLIRRFV